VSKVPEALPPNYRWNFAALIVDFVSFGVAFTLISPSSVLPAFVRQLTDAAPLVGLVSTVWMGGWMLPQLVAARVIGDKPRKKPYIYIAFIGRAALWVVPLALWAGLGLHTTAMLALFFVCLGLFAVTDGFSAVPWFDILARAIPLNRRGRLIGTGQFISGLAGIGAGALIGIIFDQVSFPGNHALLFLLACVAFIPSTISTVLIREPPPAAHAEARRRVSRNWLHPLVADPAFRHLMLCRVLFGTLGMATSFYVVHAADVLGLPDRVVGEFVMAQTLASVASSVAFGLVSERWGPRSVIRIGIATAMVGPLFALTAHLVRTGWLAQAYPLVFVALGVMNSTYMLGFTNYMLELAPDAARPAYVGLGNTIASVMALAPTLGGWLLEATSYTVLFGLTSAIVAASFLVSLGLRPVAASVDARESAQLAARTSPEDHL